MKIGEVPSKLNRVFICVPAKPRNRTPANRAEPPYACDVHDSAVADVHAVLEQASDIQDAVGVEHESPKLIPVIVTMLPAESAVLSTLPVLATGAAKCGSPQV